MVKLTATGTAELTVPFIVTIAPLVGVWACTTKLLAPAKQQSTTKGTIRRIFSCRNLIMFSSRRTQSFCWQ
jgi:hypothetical protein